MYFCHLDRKVMSRSFLTVWMVRERFVTGNNSTNVISSLGKRVPTLIDMISNEGIVRWEDGAQKL